MKNVLVIAALFSSAFRHTGGGFDYTSCRVQLSCGADTVITSAGNIARHARPSERGPAGIRGPPGPVGLKGSKGEPCDCSNQLAEFRNQVSSLTPRGCPQTKFDFPTSGQISDWIRVKMPIPDMTELSICTWITPHSLTTTSRTIVSYATRSDHNALLLEVSTDRIGLFLNGVNAQGYIAISGKTHLCATASPANGWSLIYINGRVATRLTYSSPAAIEGGGSFLIGQEQDTFFGELDANQAFAGIFENLMMWYRVLTPSEIIELHGNHCSCPEGFRISFTPDEIQLSGKVAALPVNQC